MQPLRLLLPKLLVLVLAAPAVIPNAMSVSTVDCVLYSTTFSSNWGGWSHGGAGDEWEIGKPSYGTTHAHSGSNAWGTDLDSTYEAVSAAVLISPRVTLPAVATNIELKWWHYVDLASGDSATVTVGPTVKAEYTSDSGDWVEQTASLNDQAGQIISVAFALESDASDQAAGWYMDDFSITAYGVPDTCPSGTTFPRFPSDGTVQFGRINGGEVEFLLLHGLSCEAIELDGNEYSTRCFPDMEGNFACGWPYASAYVEGEDDGSTGGSVTTVAQCFGTGTGSLPTVRCTANAPASDQNYPWGDSCDAFTSPDDPAGNFPLICTATVEPNPVIVTWYSYCSIHPPPDDWG